MHYAELSPAANATLERFRETFLEIQVIRAARDGDVLELEVLSDRGANLHVYEDMPLRAAVRHGHRNAFEFLVGHGANMHARGGEARELAAQLGWVPVALH